MSLIKLTDNSRGTPVYINPDYVQVVHASGKCAMLEMNGSAIHVKESLETVVYRLQGGLDA